LVVCPFQCGGRRQGGQPCPLKSFYMWLICHTTHLPCLLSPSFSGPFMPSHPPFIPLDILNYLFLLDRPWWKVTLPGSLGLPTDTTHSLPLPTTACCLPGVNGWVLPLTICLPTSCHCHTMGLPGHSTLLPTMHLLAHLYSSTCLPLCPTLSLPWTCSYSCLYLTSMPTSTLYLCPPATLVWHTTTLPTTTCSFYTFSALHPIVCPICHLPCLSVGSSAPPSLFPATSFLVLTHLPYLISPQVCLCIAAFVCYHLCHIPTACHHLPIPAPCHPTMGFPAASP